MDILSLFFLLLSASETNLARWLQSDWMGLIQQPNEQWFWLLKSIQASPRLVRNNEALYAYESKAQDGEWNLK